MLELAGEDGIVGAEEDGGEFDPAGGGGGWEELREDVKGVGGVVATGRGGGLVRGCMQGRLGVGVGGGFT